MSKTEELCFCWRSGADILCVPGEKMEIQACFALFCTLVQHPRGQCCQCLSLVPFFCRLARGRRPGKVRETAIVGHCNGALVSTWREQLNALEAAEHFVIALQYGPQILLSSCCASIVSVLPLLACAQKNGC